MFNFTPNSGSKMNGFTAMVAENDRIVSLFRKAISNYDVQTATTLLNNYFQDLPYNYKKEVESLFDSVGWNIQPH